MKHFYSFTFMFWYEKKNIKNACAHCYWSKKFEMSRAEGRSLLAVRQQICSRWWLLERVVSVRRRICLGAEHEWRGDLLVVIVSACQAISTANFRGSLKVPRMASEIHFADQCALKVPLGFTSTNSVKPSEKLKTMLCCIAQ